MRTLVSTKSPAPSSRTAAAERHVRTLLDRARSLRAQAGSMPEPIAAAYRRRASELDLEAFAYGARHSVRDEAVTGLLAA